MRLTIRQPWLGMRAGIRPRRGIAFTRAALSNAGAGARVPGAWHRLPIALAWRRRGRDRLLTILRMLASTPPSRADRPREVRTHHESRLVVTRLFAGHVFHETGSAPLVATPLMSRHLPAADRPRIEAAQPRMKPRVEVRSRFDPLQTRHPHLSAGVQTTATRARGFPIALPSRLSRLVPEADTRVAGVTRNVQPAAQPHAVNPRQGARSAPPAAGRAWPFRGVVIRDAAVSHSPHKVVAAAAPMAMRRPAGVGSPAAPALVTSAFLSQGAPPLVWRTPRTPMPSESAAAIQPGSRVAPPEVATISREVHGASRGHSVDDMTAVNRAPAATPALSGPAIDRLAEDVMRRIERRIRIERERRGV